MWNCRWALSLYICLCVCACVCNLLSPSLSLPSIITSSIHLFLSISTNWSTGLEVRRASTPDAIYFALSRTSIDSNSSSLGVSNILRQPWFPLTIRSSWCRSDEGRLIWQVDVCQKRQGTSDKENWKQKTSWSFKKKRAGKNLQVFELYCQKWLN